MSSSLGVQIICLITLVSKHPILVIPKEEKIGLVIPRQWHHSFSMKGEKKPCSALLISRKEIF